MDVKMIQLLGLTVESKAEIKEFVGGVQAQVNRFRKCLELYVVGRKEYVDCYYRVGTVFYTYGESDLIINARDRQGKSKEYKTLRGLVNFLAKQFDSCVEKSVLEKLIQDAIEIDEIEKKKEKELKEMESSIKSRTTEFDIASEFIKEVTGGVWSLQNFEINGYCSAVKDRKLTVNFEVDENYKITKTLGGDMVAHGDWFDLDSNDERLLEGAKDLQEQLDKMARIDVKLKFDGVHRVYPQEADKIIEERKIKGKFYLRDADKWVGIDNEDGDAWTEEFSSLIECIDWLIGKTFDCFKCGEVEIPYVSTTITLVDKFGVEADYYDEVDLDFNYSTEVMYRALEEYAKEFLEEKRKQCPNHGFEIKKYDFGLFCPECLNSLE